MKKIFLLIIIFLLSNTCASRTVQECHDRCLEKSIQKYMNESRDCKSFCKKRKGRNYFMCFEDCIYKCRNDAFDRYDNCFDDCRNELQTYQIKYKWLTRKLFVLYEKRSRQYHVPLRLALALIHIESRGKNIISKTNDYGRMQINKVHMKNNPRKLLNDKINSKIGFWYLGAALKKAKWNKYEAIRLYNQGLAGKRWKYKNWKYVNKVMQTYEG